MGLTWEQFSWSSGADKYSFAITDGGLYGTLRTSGRPEVTLPMAAWEGMLECLKVNRKTKTKTDALLPPRAGALWSSAESDELVVAFRAGLSVARLAEKHSRTRSAIESQLEKLGLIPSRYSAGAGREGPSEDRSAPPR